MKGMPSPPKLTRRQVEILHLVADGESDAEIARALKISPQMVKAHVSKVRDRLLIQYPHLKGGRPRPVILRFFMFANGAVFGGGGEAGT